MITSMAYIRNGDDLTATHTYAKPSGVGRSKQFEIRLTLPLTADMAARIDAARHEGEARLDLIRTALEAELKRRSKAKPS